MNVDIMTPVLARGRFAVCVVLLALLPSAVQAEAWASYGNARFDYAICYPSDRLRPQPEADNGDGRVFEGEGGATLRVWGSNNALDETVADAASRAAADLGTPSLRVVKRDGYVLSGRKGGMIYYTRSALHEGQFKTFVLTYPADRAKDWDPVAARLSSCFRAR